MCFRLAPVHLLKTKNRDGVWRVVGESPISSGETVSYAGTMNIILLIIVLLLLFVGGGFYIGGPAIGGGGLGLILLIVLIVYFMGGFRRK